MDPFHLFEEKISSSSDNFEINSGPLKESEFDESMYPQEIYNPLNKPTNEKKLPEFGLDNTNTDQENSDIEDSNSSCGNSVSPIINLLSKTKKEPKKKRQQYAEFWPCLEILVSIYDEGIFEVKKFTELTEEQKEVVFSYLEKILTKERLNELKSFLSQKSLNMMNSLLLKSTDYCSKKSRIDEVLKLVTSQALKKLYQNFMKANGINKSFNPKKYTKRADINLKIYQHYFKQTPINDEHMKLFLIKNGVTREWFEGAVCGSRRCPAFIEELLKILRDDHFFHFYKHKIDSMIRRILGVVEFAEEDELLTNEVEKAKKIKSKLQGGVDPKKAKKPKMPCHKYLFQQCVKDTINKIEELAIEKQIKLSSKK
jgi:hypothetical protein